MRTSFLHWLNDNSPGEDSQSGTVPERREDVISTLMSDLNMLFSSRPLSVGLELSGQLDSSILTYGVMDVLDVDILNNERVEVLGQNIKQAITKFEPRLKNVNVTLKKNTPENIVFWISGIFYGERIAFSISWCCTAYTYSLLWGS